MVDGIRERLGVAVRSIKWSYAFFWSLSTAQPGVLEWADGYYNGDIKTRITVQGMDPNRDSIGLQRTMQLRKLYESLVVGESEQFITTMKPCAASLSPEDLSDAEWYYLVCMSFVFNPGQGLPGRALMNGELIWLCNAPYADNRVFCRSLLAKSASIQTVVCFPHLGGVVELGVTELVLEDPSLIQHIKISFLDLSKPVCSHKSSSSSHNSHDDHDPTCARVDDDRVSDFNGIINKPLNADSPLESSNGSGSEFDQWTDDSFYNESCTFIEANTDDDLRYTKTVLDVLKRSNEIIGHSFGNIFKSSFWSWKKRRMFDGPMVHEQQSMLKKILYLVHSCSQGGGGNDFICNGDQKGNMNGKVLELESVVGKIDKASNLDNTIEYLDKLEARVGVLESRMDLSKYLNFSERMSDIYDEGKTKCSKKPWLLSKRKAYEVDESETLDMKVVTKGGEAVIELRCPWRDYLLIDIVDAMNNLDLDPYSVHSSTSLQGILNVTLKVKFRGGAVVPVSMIKQALWRLDHR